MKRLNKCLLVLCLVVSGSTIAQNGVHFDYVDDFISTGYNGISGNDNRTFEAWVKAPMTAGQIVITDIGTVGTGTRFTLALINGLLRVEVQGSGMTGTTLVGDDTWHHVVVVYDNGATNKFTTYVDGALEGNFNLATAVNTGTSVGLQIGIRVDGAKQFSGVIDEVKVWNVARSQSEITATMNDELCTIPSSLVAYYKLNEGTSGGTNTGIISTIDYSANMNNGTLNNFALTGASSNWVSGQTLNVMSASTFSQTFSECDGFSVTVNGNNYSTTGNYIDVIAGGAASGCDSIVTTDLTIIAAPITNLTLVECAGYSTVINGNTYDATGVYSETMTSVGGCDSTINLDLTVLPEVSFSIVEANCFGDTTFVNGIAYTGSGNFTIVIPAGAANGCDSLVYLDLTVAGAVDVSTTTSGTAITASNAAGSYVWIDCDNNNAVISGESNQTYNASSNGNYAVVVTEGTCSDTSSCVAITVVGFDEVNNLNMGAVYPNPSTGMVNISIAHLSNTKVIVVDQMGRIIESIKIEENMTSLNLSEREAGIYFFRIMSNEGSLVVPVVIE